MLQEWILYKLLEADWGKESGFIKRESERGSFTGSSKSDQRSKWGKLLWDLSKAWHSPQTWMTTADKLFSAGAFCQDMGEIFFLLFFYTLHKVLQLRSWKFCFCQILCTTVINYKRTIKLPKHKKSLKLDCTQGETVFNNYELWVSENKKMWQHEKCKHQLYTKQLQTFNVRNENTSRDFQDKNNQSETSELSI